MMRGELLLAKETRKPRRAVGPAAVQVQQGKTGQTAHVKTLSPRLPFINDRIAGYDDMRIPIPSHPIPAIVSYSVCPFVTHAKLGSTPLHAPSGPGRTPP